jgi:hypothetical protein
MILKSFDLFSGNDVGEFVPEGRAGIAQVALQ